VDTSLVISIVAVIIAVASAAFAGVSANSARRSARAEEGVLAIERERRLEERQPRLTTKLDGTGENRTLWITLESAESLAGLEVEITGSHFYKKPEGQGGWDCEFNPRVYGVVVPKPGRPAVIAFGYNSHNGERAGLQQHDSISWAMNTKKRLEWIRVKVACQGMNSERWVFQFNVDAQPEIEDTMA
jgi:hypothetical protein